ncbi:MAG: KEOPS complex Pcc1-like subunit [Euryarchaeota archaeon]|nr:KEOPS complex Pcc1-like subunit [Euryarchaeota archaeon]
MSAPHTASLACEYDDFQSARLIERSILPEVADLGDERSSVAVSRNGEMLTIRIEAADLVALRAAMNTWLTLLDTTETVAELDSRRPSSDE